METNLIINQLKVDYYCVNSIGWKFGLNWCFGLIPKYKSLWVDFLKILILVINILVIVSYNEQEYSWMSEKLVVGDLVISPEGTFTIFTILGILIFMLSFILASLELIHKIPEAQTVRLYKR